MNAQDGPRALADALAGADRLHDPAWATALAAVPRHVLVPRFHIQDPGADWTVVDADDPRYLPTVYSDTTLVTELADLGAGYREPVSSSTQPGLMIRMLETLALRDGQRVLEIGTGTGYNAALLAHRLGDHNTFSVDVSPHLVDLASERLAALGLHPHLTVTDGAQGWPEHAPYDAVLGTCSVPAIPQPWIEQTREDGHVLVDLKVASTAGNLVLLRRHGHRATGRFAQKYAAFMGLRHTTTDHAPESAATVAARSQADSDLHTERDSAVLVDPTKDTVAWFLAAVRMPVGVTFGYTLDPDTREPDGVLLHGADGSTSHVTMNRDSASGDDGGHRVVETGPTPLHQHVEAAHRQWTGWDRPGWERLGLTVDAATGDHTLWLDDPRNEFFTLGK